MTGKCASNSLCHPPRHKSLIALHKQGLCAWLSDFNLIVFTFVCTWGFRGCTHVRAAPSYPDTLRADGCLRAAGWERAISSQQTRAGRKETAVISLLWENKRVIDFVTLSSSVSEYSSWITSQQSRFRLVCADVQCDGISLPVSAVIMQLKASTSKMTG